MPMLNLKCSKEVSDDMQQELSKAVARIIGKPETYVMVVAEKASILMSGEKGDAAYVEVKSIGGLDRTVNGELTDTICLLLNDLLFIPSERVYVTFQSVERDHWGWDGSTFG